MAERQIGYRKLRVVLSARFSFVNRRSRAVAKSAKQSGFSSDGDLRFCGKGGGDNSLGALKNPENRPFHKRHIVAR